MTTTLVRATPFHARSAASNRLNRWTARNGWTLACSYGDPALEPLSARAAAAITDISWRWRVMIEGAQAEALLSRLLTRDPSTLAPGSAFKALWLTDRGGVRGAGVLARYGRDSFLLVASTPDRDWIVRGAALFDVSVREVADEEGGLAIVGPYAAKTIAAAGLEQALEPLQFRKLFWHGLDVTLSRFGEHGGFEVWCKTEDAAIVWDRIARAGTPFGLRCAGLDAMDILDLEAGIARPGRDFEPAGDGYAEAPTVFELGLESLVDESHHVFNGRASYLKAPRDKTCVGISFDGGLPPSGAMLLRAGRDVGRVLQARHSPALQGPIALAIVEGGSAAPGVSLTTGCGTAGKICVLPFLPVPVQIAP